MPHKRAREVETRVIELRRSHPAWEPEQLKFHFELPISTKAIARMIRQARKKRLGALEFIQLDTKDLAKLLGLPRGSGICVKFQGEETTRIVHKLLTSL